jgi:hypothetical protein
MATPLGKPSLPARAVLQPQPVSLAPACALGGAVHACETLQIVPATQSAVDTQLVRQEAVARSHLNGEQSVVEMPLAPVTVWSPSHVAMSAGTQASPPSTGLHTKLGAQSVSTEHPGPPHPLPRQA